MERINSDQIDIKRKSIQRIKPPRRSLSDRPSLSLTSSSRSLIRCRPIGSDSDTDNSEVLRDFAAPMARDIEEERRFREANRGNTRRKSFKPTRRGAEDAARPAGRDPEELKALKWRPKEGRPAEHMTASVAIQQRKYNPLIKILGIKIKIIRSDDGNDDDCNSTDGEPLTKPVPSKPDPQSQLLSTTEPKGASLINANETNLISSSHLTLESNSSDELPSTASEDDPPNEQSRTDSSVFDAMNTARNESITCHPPPQELVIEEELSTTASEEDSLLKPSRLESHKYEGARANQSKPAVFLSRTQKLDTDEELSTTASEEDFPKTTSRAGRNVNSVMDTQRNNLSSPHDSPQESDLADELSTTASDEECTKKLSKTESSKCSTLGTGQMNVKLSLGAPEVLNSSDELSATASEDDSVQERSRTCLKRCKREISYPRVQSESRPNFEISDETQDAIGPLQLDENFALTASINKFLKPYQRDGVKFLFKHFRLQNGVILGDDMGLGKTIQVIAFLSAIMGLKGVPKEKKRRKSAINRLPSDRTYKPSELGPTCLVICPNSVIDNWASEIQTWGYFEYATLGGAVSGAETIPKFNAGAFDILICGFNYARDHIDNLYDLDFTVVVVDEVQKLKNHRSTITRAFHQFKTKIRFGLTGTAMQNDLMELHSLFNWVRPGALGTQRMWKAFVANPILQSRKSNASTYEREMGKERATALVEKCWPDLQLRRTKAKILHELPRRTDKIALCPMTVAQKYAYQNLLSDPDVINMRKNNEPCPCGRTNKSGLRFSLGKCCDQGWDRRIFPYIQVFKKIANHLALTYPNKQDNKEKYEQDKLFIRKMFPNDYLEREYTFSCGYDSKLCGKWIVLKPLLEKWQKDQAQVLLFSQSTKMMDLLEHWLEEDFPGFVRLDGDVRTSERFKRVEEFQSDCSKFIFLASTTAAGVGLNLTAANKVVIFDPSWNPSIDAQAMDRVVRIGQKRDVECIRLISLGSTEELIYHRQVYKQHLSEIANTGHAPDRQFAGVQGDKKNQGEIFGVKNIFRDQGGGRSGMQTEQCREEYSYAINQFMAHDPRGNGSAEEFALKPLNNLPEYSKSSSNSTEAILRDFGVGQILNHGDVVKASLEPNSQTDRSRHQWKKDEGKSTKIRCKIPAAITAPPLRGGKLKAKAQEKATKVGKNNESSGATDHSSDSDSSLMEEICAKDFASFSSKQNKQS